MNFPHGGPGATLRAMASLEAVVACVQLVIVGTPTAPDVIRQSVQQAAAIWRPHRVMIAVEGDLTSCPAEATVESVTVVMSDVSEISAKLQLPRLGEIQFAGDGLPDPEIVIAAEYLQKEVEKATWSGRSLADRPLILRQRAAARAIGRVLAHELGHYLLRMPQHGRTGLMRPVYSIPALLEPATRKYSLAPADAARLRGLLLDRRIHVTRR
jgi:hypothetical protein